MSQPTPSPARPRKRKRVLFVVAASIAALVGAWLLFQNQGRTQRQAALDEVIKARDPLLPSDLVLPEDQGRTDPTDWLARVAGVRNAWEMSDVSDPRRYEKLLDSARAGSLGEDARVAFERFEACIRPWLEEQKDPGAAWNAWWIDVAVRLQEADGTREWGECAQSVAQLLATGLAPSMELAREAATLGPIDPRRVAKSLDEKDGAFPLLPFVQEARLADAVQITALHDVQQERHGAALDDVRAGFAVARVHEPPTWLLSWMVWTIQVRRALETLQMILPQLPHGLDVSDIEARLTAMDPGGALVTALKGERAFGNRVFEALREGWTPADDEPFVASSVWASVQQWLVADRDQAAYLEAMDRYVAIADEPAFLRKDVPVERPSTFFAPATSVVLPAIAGPLATSDALKARLALARLALTTYRGGAQEALRFMSESVDPYDGKPLRLAWAGEDVVVFWSVGPDKVDQSAATGSDDIVWLLRLAK